MAKSHQFTQGTWVVRSDKKGSGDQMIGVYDNLAIGGFSFIAEVCRDMRGPDSNNKAEQAANVRLLLAAPKMYALLHRGLTGDGGSGAWLMEVRDLLEDDIDAEGEAA